MGVSIQPDKQDVSPNPRKKPLSNHPSRSFAKEQSDPHEAPTSSQDHGLSSHQFESILEQFYNRYDERSKPVLLPEYTTDTFDHERESAENKLNEEIEQNENIPVDSDSDFEDDIFIWNVHEKSTTPPKTLMD